MKFSLRKLLNIGLPLAGMALGAGPVPSIVSQRMRRHGRRDDPTQGHDFAALGIRQIIQASFPELLGILDRIALAWAGIVAQEMEAAEPPKPKRRRRVKARL